MILNFIIIIIRKILRLFLGKSYLKRIVNVLTPKHLMFNNIEIEYFFHTYNNFGVTERSIEIPIVEYYLDRNQHDEILEIGNVSNYYQDRFNGKIKSLDVVDKFEDSRGVITCDIAKYKTNKNYDFIFSISTFEHMDSDRGRNIDHSFNEDAKKGTVAIDNILYCYNNLLKEGGVMIITAPLTYSNEWDRTFADISNDVVKFNNCDKIIFERVSEFEWKQVSGDMQKLVVEQVLSNGEDNYLDKYLSIVTIHK